MAQPAIAGRDLFPAQLQTVSRNASFHGDRARAGCPLASALDLNPPQHTHYLLPCGWEPALLKHCRVLT
jgi:hypothetical protein